MQEQERHLLEDWSVTLVSGTAMVIQRQQPTGTTTYTAGAIGATFTTSNDNITYR